MSDEEEEEQEWGAAAVAEGGWGGGVRSIRSSWRAEWRAAAAAERGAGGGVRSIRRSWNMEWGRGNFENLFPPTSLNLKQRLDQSYFLFLLVADWSKNEEFKFLFSFSTKKRKKDHSRKRGLTSDPGLYKKTTLKQNKLLVLFFTPIYIPERGILFCHLPFFSLTEKILAHLNVYFSIS